MIEEDDEDEVGLAVSCAAAEDAAARDEAAACHAEAKAAALELDFAAAADSRLADSKAATLAACLGLGIGLVRGVPTARAATVALATMVARRPYEKDESFQFPARSSSIMSGSPGEGRA